MTSWERIADLPLQVDGYELEPLRMQISRGMERVTTVVRLRGDALEGLGEDVTFDAAEQDAALGAGPVLPLAGAYTVASFCDHVGALDLFPTRAPEFEMFRGFRRWAYEAAALDLALSQAGLALHEALGREPRPLHFVTSLHLGEPASLDPLQRRLDAYPSLRFKLDAEPGWTDEIVAGIVATGAVDTVDFKGLYERPGEQATADPALYARVADAFPDAWLEDPRLTEETDAILRAHRDRITWDAPIHGVADVAALPFPPRALNIKPSRIGSLRGLLDLQDHLAEGGTGAYGGGQFELGPGRGQIELLASIFHPSGPNDVAPTGFHAPDLPPGLPASPLEPRPSPTGMRWG